MTAAPEIKAVVPWFGGKRTLASKIVAELGPHKAYVEPFCGSCAVLFAKPQTAYETVNDLHGDLVNLLRCLAIEDAAVRIYGHAARTVMAEAVLEDACELLAEGLPPPDGELSESRAWAFLVQSWMSRNGTAGTKLSDDGNSPGIAARFTFKGGSPTTRWASMVTSIPWWHERLRSVVVLNRDAFELLARLPDEDGLVVYADPPYLPETRTSYGAGGAGEYRHDFAPGRPGGDGLFGDDPGREGDHERLAAALGRFKHARVVVSYYAHARLAELYPGWRTVDCAQHKNTANASSREGGAVTSPEVLLVNGPSLTS